MRKRLICLALLGMTACGGNETTAPSEPRTLQVVNYLYAQIAIHLDNVAVGAIPSGSLGGSSATFPLTSSARTVSYQVASQLYGDGSFVPNDLGGETIALPSTDATLGVTNIVQGQPYIIFHIANSSRTTLMIAYAAGGVVRCLGSLPDIGGQWYGYYALTTDSQVRLYRAGSNCTGPNLAWSTAQLNAYQINSGALFLSAATAP